MKKKVLIVLMVVVVITGLVFALAGCKDGTVADYTAMNIDMGENYYIGTEGSVDLSAMFGDATFTATGNISVSGKTATATAAGTGTLTVNGTTKTVTVVEGKNVTDYAGLSTTLKAGKNAVLQVKNMSLDENAETIRFSASIYGNGCKINAHELVKKSDGSHFLMLMGKDDLQFTVRDLHITGKEMQEGDKLSDLEGYGILLALEGEATNRVRVTIDHCLFENGHKVVHFQATTATISNTVVRNASDSTISIRTADNMANRLTFDGINYITGSITAGITVYGYEAINATNGVAYDYNRLTVKGQLALYTWREISSISLMPGTETGASLINGIISDNLKKKKYEEFMYTHDGEKYIHFAILFLSTNDSNKCLHEITGLEENKFVERNFPMPDIASNFMNTCKVFGYEESVDENVKPGALLVDDPRLAGMFTVTKAD